MVDVQAFGCFFISHEVDEEFENYFVILLDDPEVLSIKALSGVLQDGEAFGEWEGVGVVVDGF